MKLFKKATAVLALVTLVSGIFSTGVAAYSTAQLEAANALAAEGVIVSHSDVADYNLDQNVLRQEIAAVARGVADLAKTETCNGTYNDVTATSPNNWACYSIEALSNAGLIALNDNFRPEEKISKAEAVGMMVKAAYGDDYTYDSSKGTTWQEQVVAYAVEKGVIANFTNYDTSATRGFVFEVGASAMTSEDVASDDDLLSDLLGDLLGDDDEPTDEPTDDTTDDTTPVIPADNVLEVYLSPETPDGATIPGAINGLPVAKFDFTAGSEDVTVTSLIVKRKGLSDSATLTSLAVFTSEGRVSKGKNDSEENNTQATLNLNSGGVTIMAGETETFTIVVDVVTAVGNSGDEFAIELLNVNATSDVEGIDDLVANTMKIGGVDAANLIVDTNGSVSNPTLGEDDADIFKFKLENSTDFDIVTKSITFKGDGSIDEEDELVNFKLIDNDGEVVAETASTNGKYLTFDLGEGFVVAENKTEKFKVTADIIGGAAKTIKFYVDKNLDITAEDTQYGFGASVTITNVDASGNLGTLTIDAGELTLIDLDPTTTKIREDKKDINLGKIKIVNNAGGDLEIQKFGFKIVVTDSGPNATKIGDIFDNIELYDETNGTTYDLATVFDGTDDSLTEAFGDADLNITVPTGEMTLAIRADTVNSITDFNNVTITTSVATGDLTANGGLYIVEIEDDTVVTDITPGSLSFKTIDGAESSATVTVLPLSTAKSAVIGSEDVVALEFEVEADESSDLKITEISLQGTVVGGNNLFESSRVSQIALYKNSVSDSNLIKAESGNSIASEIITFDGLNVNVPADGKVKLIATVTIVDDATNAGDTIKLALDSDNTNIRVAMEDDDSDDVVFVGATDLASARTITISGAGTLSIAVDNSDSETDNLKNVLGNTTSDFVASYELTAVNEPILIKDLEIVATGANFSSAVSEVIIYEDNQTTEIARESVTSNTVTFSNINYVVEEGNENIYVKVITRKIGKDEAGILSTDYTLTAQVTDADGDDSGKAIALPAITSASLGFKTVPVKISAVSFVSNYGGETVASNLTNGENTIGIIAVTTDTSTNTNSTDGSSLKVELESIKVSVSSDAVYDVLNDTLAVDYTGLTVEQINGTVSATAIVNEADGTTALAGDVTLTNGINLLRGVALGADKEIDNSSTTYYVVKATFSSLDSSNNKYIQLKLENLDTASTIEYSSDNVDDVDGVWDAGDNITSLRTGTTSISGTSISSNY